MRNTFALLIVHAFAFGTLASATVGDGSNIPQCKGVTDVCMAAAVTSTDSKTGKTVQGYQPGEHKADGKGLWADCVHPLAKGSTVPGVTGVTKQAAHACAQAYHASQGKHQ